MVDRADSFDWSSAAAHTGLVAAPDWLEPEPMQSTFTPEQWNLHLQSDTIADAEVELRVRTYTGRPAGSSELVEWAESNLGRKLAPQPGGRPPQGRRRRAGSVV
jgi:hypothetical protein